MVALNFHAPLNEELVKLIETKLLAQSRSISCECDVEWLSWDSSLVPRLAD
jgi:hypothetical protein